MSFCEECGAKIESDATFCEKCHHTVSKNNQVKNQPTGPNVSSSNSQSDSKIKPNSSYKYLGIALLLISGLLIILTILNSGSYWGGLKGTRQITADIMILLLIGVGGWYFYSKGQPKKTSSPPKIRDGKGPILETSSLIEKNEPVQEIQGKKSPILAAICSLVIPGLGQVYVGDIRKGIAIFFGTLIGIFIWIIPGLIVWVFGIYDAYTIAQKINNGELPFKKSQINIKKTLFYICLIFSILSLLIFSLSTFGGQTYLLSSGNWNIHPEPFWSIIVLLGLLLLIFYFIYKIKGYPFLLNASKGDDQNSKKSPHVRLIAILLLGIFLAWLISISFFTFGAINSPNDGKCDYDNENAVVFFLSAQENSIHVQEFCSNHIQFYTMLNPLYILSLPLKLTPHLIIDLTGVQLFAKFSIVIWVIFLLFVLASSVNFSNQDSEGFFIWKRHDSIIKPLIFGILGGLSFMVSFFLTCQMIYMIHVLGNSDYHDALAMSAGNWPVYFILVLPCIVFTISIIRDARR